MSEIRRDSAGDPCLDDLFVAVDQRYLEPDSDGRLIADVDAAFGHERDVSVAHCQYENCSGGCNLKRNPWGVYQPVKGTDMGGCRANLADPNFQNT